MRNLLDDIEMTPEDLHSRARDLDKPAQPKRFYKHAGVGTVENGFSVTLDGRTTKTPGRKLPVVVPVAGIATLMAQEWDAQGEFIVPDTMPTVRLINAALEAGPDAGPALRAEIVKYCGGDLLLYRAEGPRELVALHDKYWDEALVAVARHFNVSFQPTIGIVHQEQPAATLARLGDSLADENVLVLSALVSLTTLTGSGLLTLGLWHRLLTPDQVWVAAHVDEDYQISLWGEDAEASQRRAWRRAEFDATARVLDLLRV